MQHENQLGLQELRHSDYAIVENEPDIEGWSIYDGGHQHLGRVHDLLFDPSTQQVRYIIVHLKEKLPGNDAEQVLVPIGMAELHESDDEVLLPSVTQEQLGQFSPYPFDALKINATDGSAISLSARTGMDTEPLKGEDQWDDSNFYRNRKGVVPSEQKMPVITEQSQVDKARTETGGIRLRSRN